MAASKKPISIAEKIEALASLAAEQVRSCSYLINAVIDNHLELCAYQDALVRNGLAEMRMGLMVGHKQVVKRLKGEMSTPSSLPAGGRLSNGPNKLKGASAL